MLSQPSPSPTVAPPGPVPSTPVEAVSDWSRVPHDETVFGGPGKQSMVDVTVGGPGFVAVGSSESEASESEASESEAAVWASIDGVALGLGFLTTRTVFGGPDEQLMVSVIAAGGPGLRRSWRVTSLITIQMRRCGPLLMGSLGLGFPYDETVFGGAVEQSMSDVTVGGPGLGSRRRSPTRMRLFGLLLMGSPGLGVPHDDIRFRWCETIR